MIAFVTGASGVIGRRLVSRLAAEGVQVRVLCRKPPPAGFFNLPVELFIGDITDQTVLRAAMPGVNVVFHLAAKLHINNPGLHLADEYRQTNVEGTRLLVQAALAANVACIVYLSTIAVYGVGQAKSWFDETSRTNPRTIYAQTKLAGEKFILDAKSLSSGLPLGVVLRSAAVYGPLMKGNYRLLVKGLKSGWFIPIGRGLNRRTLIHVDDLIGALLSASKNKSALGQVFNVTDGQVHPLHKIITAISRSLGRKPPRWFIPESVARQVAFLSEIAFNCLGKASPLNVGLIERMTEDIAVDGSKLQHVLDFHPQYGLLDGWHNAIQAGF